MRAHEFIVEKKRKKRKPRWAAYGPGPYGGYGYAVGYSGDGGGIGGDAAGGEASYPGNIGAMEVMKFFQIADDKKKELFKELLSKGKKGLAWKLIQDTVGVKLVGKEFEVEENFADGRVKGKSRPGRVKRAGASCSGSVTDLRKRAKNASGEKAKMYHWCANMKSGRGK
jgi:hypothetical protein